MTEVFQYLTLKMGIDPRYVLDEMQMYEVAPLFEKVYYCDMETWNQARLITWMVAQVNSRKKIKFEDVASFPWDDETPHSEKEVTVAEKERLRAKARAYAKEHFNTES